MRIRSKKLLLFTLPPILLLAVFSFQLLDSSPSDVDAEALAETRLPEIDIADLKLFRNFKGLKIEQSGLQTSPGGSAIRRDPFVRPGAVPYKPEEGPEQEQFTEDNLKLTGILWDAAAPSAVINGQIVQVGSRLGPFRVSRIQPEKVVLAAGYSWLVLEIENERDKTVDEDEDRN